MYVLPQRQGKTELKVLWLGFTRDLWLGPEQAQRDTLQRFLDYSRYLAAFHVVAHSLRSHNLASRKKLAHNFWAYATNGYTPLDSWLRMLYLGWQLGRRVRFDVIQAQDALFSGVVGSILQRLLKVPLNVNVYEANPFNERLVKDRWYWRLGVPLARKVVYQAQGLQVDASATARLLVERGLPPEKIFLKPDTHQHLADFLNAERDVALREELTEGGRFSRLVLFVGRLIAQKNPGFVIPLAERVIPIYPRVRFICVGDGPLREKLARETARQGLGDYVLWVGGLPHREVVRYMAACDVFILPSLYEGLAEVLVEAAAAGKPIVATAVGGTDDAVKEGESGYIVPVGDREAFASRLIELLQNPALAAEMGRRGRRHVETSLLPFNNPEFQIWIWAQVAARAALDFPFVPGDV